MPDDALLEELLGVQLPGHLLETALCHRSYAYEHRLASNERLEWLGDAALELYVSDVLYRVDPELSEAELSNLRATLVSRVALASVAGEMGLGRWVRLGRGETATGGEEKPSILADALEALIGAAYEHGGQALAAQLCRRLLRERIEAALQADEVNDAKARLAALSSATPQYSTWAAGPLHSPWFLARVRVGNWYVGGGEATTKKEAEQLAAAAACERLAGPGEVS